MKNKPLAMVVMLGMIFAMMPGTVVADTPSDTGVYVGGTNVVSGAAITYWEPSGGGIKASTSSGPWSVKYNPTLTLYPTLTISNASIT